MFKFLDSSIHVEKNVLLRTKKNEDSSERESRNHDYFKIDKRWRSKEEEIVMIMMREAKRVKVKLMLYNNDNNKINSQSLIFLLIEISA